MLVAAGSGGDGRVGTRIHSHSRGAGRLGEHGRCEMVRRVGHRGRYGRAAAPTPGRCRALCRAWRGEPIKPIALCRLPAHRAINARRDGHRDAILFHRGLWKRYTEVLGP